MTDKAETQTEPNFRIHWRVASTGETGQETGLYSEDEAKVWIAALNRGVSNVKQGRVYWMEPTK